jgi:ubiquinone/menaquinone biosynthesis C-methylase UbiE
VHVGDASHGQSSYGFDGVAASYDADESPLQRWLRERTRRWLLEQFRPGQHILEIGSGTGADAVWLAQYGIRVTATDASAEMRRVIASKIAASKTGDLPITVVPFDLSGDLPDVPDSSLDGVFSNFGALNCVSEWRTLGGVLRRVVRPGGWMMFGVMSPLCAWEILWHGVHGRFGTALRRVRGNTVAHVGGVSFPVYYPTPARLARDLGAGFRVGRVRGLGVFLPPADVYGVIGARPRMASLLMRLERITSHLPVFRTMADHYWIELQRMGNS